MARARPQRKTSTLGLIAAGHGRGGEILWRESHLNDAIGQRGKTKSGQQTFLRHSQQQQQQQLVPVVNIFEYVHACVTVSSLNLEVRRSRAQPSFQRGRGWIGGRS